jgi:hypothetical protein
MGWSNLSKTLEKVPPAHVQRVYLEEPIGYPAHTGLIYLEEPIGYPAHTGLISLSVCPSI